MAIWLIAPDQSTTTMAETYVVQQGDHLSGIAQKFEFSSIDTIWDDPNNAALKKLRKNPHVLLPGDRLFIPDKKQKSQPAATGKVHTFRVDAAQLKLRIALRDFDDKPIANVPCELEVQGLKLKLNSDGDGMVETEVPRDAKEGTLRVPSLDIDMPIKIGHLDPVDVDSGWKARLQHLGYYAGNGGQGSDSGDDPEMQAAVEEFQCDHKLRVTGLLDSATKAKLKDIHGV
jgi:hypothetical protein